MGAGWTKAPCTAVCSNRSQYGDRAASSQRMSHSSSTVQNVQLSVEYGAQTRSEMSVRPGTPDTCHNSKHIVGQITPDTHGHSFLQTTPNIQDNRVIKMVKQMEEDEDYAKSLQEQMDLEFALSLQNEAATPNCVNTNIEVSSPVQGLTGRLLETSRITQSRTRATRQESDNTDEESYNNFGLTQRRHSNTNLRNPVAEVEQLLFRLAGRTRPTQRRHFNTNLRNPVAEVEQLLFQLVGRSRPSDSRGRRCRSGHGMNFVISRPARLTGGDNFEVFWNVVNMLGDVKHKGLSNSDCNRLPIRTFKKSDKVSDGQKTECLICICEYEDVDALKILPCCHEFHSSCIDKWIKANATCPVCRVNVRLQ